MIIRNGISRLSACAAVLWFCGGIAGAGELEAYFGIAGHFRTGRWTPLRIAAPPDGLPPGADSILVETLDGDGVRFAQRIDAGALRDGALTTYLPAGPRGAPLTVAIVDQAGNPASSATWRTRMNEGAVGPNRPWVVALGDSLGLELVGRNDLLGIRGAIDVSTVVDAGQLPDAWIGYDGVDLVVISGSALEILAGMSEQQSAALAEWIQGGGRLLVTLGQRGPEMLAAAPWLAQAIGSAGETRVERTEPSAIETFLSAREPLTDLAVTRVAVSDRAIVLVGRGTGVPLAWHHPWGFGLTTVFAGGMDESPAREWEQREELLNRMLPGLFPEVQRRAETRRRADLRYQELAGQVRATLDRFGAAGKVEFSAVAALILVLVGLIGPVDFFLVNRWLGRPLLGWLTFPLSIAAFSAAILLWHGGSVGSHVRQIAIVDIDPREKIGRGFVWAQIFSGRADRLDIRLAAEPEWRSAANPTGATITGPWGHAGTVFGGIELAGEDIRLPRYRLDWRGQIAQGVFASHMESVPFAPLSSKGVAARWHFPVSTEVQSQLRRRLGSDLLSGSFVNPLDADLIDGYLVYRNLAYVLPTRVPAGGQVSAVETLQARNFRWKLTRRQTTESASASEPWDPGDDDSLSRLMEMVLFYEAAGGAQYVNLDNRTLGPLDLSDALASDRAILVARVRGPGAAVLINGRLLDPESVEYETYVRVMLPIDDGQNGQRE